MGHYTEFYVNVKLKRETPTEVIAFLQRVMLFGDIGLPEGTVCFTSSDVPAAPFDHPFFKCERWYALFLSTNWDEKKNRVGLIPFYKTQTGTYVLQIWSEFKNYGQEIDWFMDWIAKYVVIGRKKKGKYIGWKKHEVADNRTYLFLTYPMRFESPAWPEPVYAQDHHMAIEKIKRLSDKAVTHELWRTLQPTK